MADIVLSYAREDRDTVNQLGSILTNQNLAVWWDKNIKVGTDFGMEIDDKITNCKKLVVSWSPHSRKSLWVRGEALKALDQGKVAQVMLDDDTPPVPFNALHAIPLKGWNGDDGHPGIQALFEALQDSPAALQSEPIEDRKAARKAEKAEAKFEKQILKAGTTPVQRISQWLIPFLMLVLLGGGVAMVTQAGNPEFIQYLQYGGFGLIAILALLTLALLRDFLRAMTD